jgi:hypothetical protein
LVQSEATVDANIQALLFLLLLFGAWLVVPLVPAWVTYKITPAQKLGLGGPLSDLTVKATGAFAAYLILLIASHQLVVKGGLSIIGSMATPSVWTFKADVMAIGPDGRPVPIPDDVKGLDVAFKPELHQIGKNKLVVQLPQNPEKWPFLTITIPGFGGAEIDLSQMNGVDLNYFKKTVELSGPITIRQAVGGGMGAAPRAAPAP